MSGGRSLGPQAATGREGAQSEIDALAAILTAYEFGEELGRGAGGIVVAASHRSLGREVAIKRLPQVSGADPQTRSRFLSEARVLASLDHPHIVPIYDFVEVEGICALVMERLSGGSVWDRWRTRGFTAPAACAVVLATSLALHHAHRKGVLHRDVKPQNLMFSGDGVLKVTDFGIAKVLGGAQTMLTQDGGVVGTPAYMAPEQVEGLALGPQTDVYSAGVVLYVLLCGQLPFPTMGTTMADLYQRVHADPIPLLDRDPAAPRALATVTARALARDPQERYATALELAVAINEAASREWGPEWGAETDLVLHAAAARDPQRPAAPAHARAQAPGNGDDKTVDAPAKPGLMTFCMSNIEDWMRLWESQSAAMADALARHDEVIAHVVEARGGRVVRAMGESGTSVSVFASAADAVAAAIDASLRLASEEWPGGLHLRPRFGLHTGEAQMRDGAYYGTSVRLAARVRDEAGAGEVLLSETTAALVRRDVPEGYAIVDLGPHSLSGIEQPEAVKGLVGPGLATAATASQCPYRGLLAFEAHDRDLFFGREEVLDDVLARIAPGHLLAVVGASGSGKSSLLRAGVIAAVEAGELASARSARLITPGAEPPLGDDDRRDELLIVDQFEELYTQCRDAERRSQFVAGLLARTGPTVIGVRADFYGEISADAELARAVAQNQVLLGPMSDDDLRRAIAEPARLAGLRLEPGFVDVVLRDVAGEPGALPLMSHALRETWERRDRRTLTVAAYEETGGVSSALAQTADAVVDATHESDRPLLRNVFLRLTEIGDDVEDTRRRAPLDELVPKDAPADTVRMLLERLADARLVTLGEGTAEVAHEVLIRRWPTLRRWLDEDREGIRLHRRLSDAARLWHAAGREPADLYRGTRLDAAVEWARANAGLLNETERAFLDASVEDAARTQHRQLIANRRLRRALAGSAGLLVLALALLVFALASRHDAVRAKASAQSRALATEAESQVVRDPQRALLLARAALAAAPTPEAQLAASEALDANTARSQLPSFGVQSCVTSNYMYLLDRGRIAVDNTCDGQVVFGDLARRRIVRRVHVGSTSTDMTLSPTGRTLVVATGRDLVSVDTRSGLTRHIFTSPWPIGWIAHGAYGGALAIGDADKVAIVDAQRHRLRVIAHGDASANAIIGMLWAARDTLLIETSGQSSGHGDLLPRLTLLNVVDGTRHAVALPVPQNHLAALSFLNITPDRRTWFITGADVTANSNDQVATTWAFDARTRRVRWIARGPIGESANALNPSPDSRLLAVGYSHGAIDVLDVATGKLVVRHSSSSSISAGWMAFPPGNRSLVTVSLDGVYRTWAAHGSERFRLQPPADPAVDFAPDGRSLVLVGARGEIVDLRSSRVLRTFPGFPAASVFNSCTSACFAASPQLRWLTYLDPTSASPRIVEIEGQTGRRVAAVTVPRLDAESVAPDGRIVVAYVDGTRLVARLIDPRSGRARDLPPGTTSVGCAATTPSFTRDSRLMAIVDGCIRVFVWDLRSGRLLRTAVLPDRANAASAVGGGGTTASGAHISPDGRYVLVTVEGGGFVRVDVATGRVAERPGTQTVAKSVAISPDGRYYAIGSQAGVVDEYDARTLRLVRHHTLNNAIQALVFSPDSKQLAVEDTDYVLRIWDTCDVCQDPKRLAARAAQQSVRELTPGERATFNVG